MPLIRTHERCFTSDGAPYRGEIARLFSSHGITHVVGHPTFRNQDNIGEELQRGMRAALRHFSGENVAFCVSDGTWNENTRDESTIRAAIAGAEKALADMAPSSRERLLIVAVPYGGYDGDYTPGKGSALKLIYEEVAQAPSVGVLILLDGDLRNDFDPWFKVFAEVEREHQKVYPEYEFFVTARYARHFVDASLTRFVVGPLTTLMGMYVPGGISGDIVLSRGAVKRECVVEWDDHRRRYGTDIATTFDNIADPNTKIYEVYLGAKLHDVTDEAKLAVMPGEVIGAALKRLLYYEENDKRISRIIQGDRNVEKPVVWGPDKTGIQFIDPGYTNVFDVDLKRTTLINRYPEFRGAMSQVLLPETFSRIETAYQQLSNFAARDDDDVTFLWVDREFWIELLYQHIAYLMTTKNVDTVKKSMSYLYTAAFCEFCKEKLFALGARTLGKARMIRKHLGVPPEIAEKFYEQEVDAVVEAMAMQFYAGRKRILKLMP